MLRLQALALTATAIFLSACSTSLGTQNTAAYSIPGAPTSAVFRNSVQSVIISGMSITSTDADAGLIVAEAPRNVALTYENTKMNILITPSGSGSLIAVSSILGGQVVDYGSSQAAIDRFCRSLRGFYPNHIQC